MASVPILIIGAGPTGLNLANLLTQYQIPFRLIEQKTAPIQTSNALAVQSRSLEMWDKMGIADHFIQAGRKIAGLTLSSGTKKVFTIDFANISSLTKFSFALGLPQAETERLLAENLTRQGGTVERGVTLLDFSQTDQAVTANVQHADGRQEEITCDWLIATDGCHSAVRKKLNLNFAGAEIQEKFIMADVVLETDLNPNYFHTYSSPDGPFVFAPMPKSTRLICSVTRDSGIKDFAHPTLSDFEYIMAKRTPHVATIKSTVWISHFVAHHRMIENYCHGRIIFAGDSAHIHSPVGGQGMNTGMQDTFNLAWKLALIVKGKCQSGLLKTYNHERHPVAKKVLSGTTKMTHVVTLGNPLLIALRNRLMGFLFAIKRVQQKVLLGVSELNVAYKPSNIIFDLDSQGKKLRAGQRAPFPEICRGIKHTLLLFSGINSSEMHADEIKKLAAEVSKSLADFFDIVIVSDSKKYFAEVDIVVDSDLKIHNSYDALEGAVFIVRPDLYVGMRSEELLYANIQRYSLF